MRKPEKPNTWIKPEKQRHHLVLTVRIIKEKKLKHANQNSQKKKTYLTKESSLLTSFIRAKEVISMGAWDNTNKEKENLVKSA